MKVALLAVVAVVLCLTSTVSSKSMGVVNVVISLLDSLTQTKASGECELTGLEIGEFDLSQKAPFDATFHCEGSAPIPCKGEVTVVFGVSTLVSGTCPSPVGQIEIPLKLEK